MTNQAQSSSAWPPRIVVCVGTVVLRENRALFVRQAKGQSLEGKWSILWGVVEPGESPDNAALRETGEEGGITAEIEGLLGYQNFSWESSVALVFLCRHVGGEPVPDGVETDRAAYFSLEELNALDAPVSPWCKWLVSRVLRGEYHTIAVELNNPRHPKLAFF